ncbi:hypothetical protein Rsub_09235 [Raphidocelis subcapitata]|uniref:TATA-binding protein interacting (TIP20) domain-containing protein n=1 Tax=Raphidocelis subcapitata TaxID=307507 RepID=A0A2V0P9B8_9CHLO|nr:hypothetical protein Rsub_09235 [Raphidocelis subcapitata]|eukprot:GBF96436.1 hypothetical protein Rsub_09235 [Raphidocelis subcapitata]
MSGAAVNLILEKIGSKDKDFRYMATSDLLGELGKESFRVDADLERRLAAAVAAQLDDVSGDISGLAVKCLALLVRRIGEANAVAAINDLCSKVVSGKKDSTRDIASIALKTVIAEARDFRVPPNSALAAPAAAAIDNTGLASDALDILGGAAAAFGPHVAQSHGQLLSALLELVDDPRPALRKRALHCLAGLSPHLSEALLRDAAAALLAKLEAEAGGGKAADARVYALGGVSRATGHRLGPFLPRALPLVISCYEGAGEGEAEDELRDQCLQALESFVSRSPAAARPHLPEVLSAALGALRHDPNFADGMDGGGDEDGMDGGGDEAGSDEDDDAGSDDGYSDDEDASWKVRRAAAKLIAAAVAAYPDALPEVYSRAAPDLLSRFREREESVKTTVMGAYCDLVASAAARHYGPDGGAGPLQVLRSDVPAALKAAAQQLAGRDVKTRAAAFGVLRALGVAAPEEVAAGLGAIVPGVLSALSDRASSAAALKIEALAFLQPLLAGGDPETLAPHLAAIGGGLFEAAGERYYKASPLLGGFVVSAEALRCCEALVRCLRPAPPAPPGPGAAALAGPLFDAASARLAAQDQDQEVKEAAIGCVAAAVAALGDQPAAEGRVEGVLATLLERLRNETTRLPAVRAAAAVAASPLPLPALAGGAAGGVVAELTGFLRKANRRSAWPADKRTSLRAASLAALEALCSRPGLGLDPAALAPAVAEAPSLLSDGDLSLAAAALALYASLARSQPGAAASLADQVLPPALELVRSPLLQGAALSALQRFLGALADAAEAAGGGGGGGGGAAGAPPAASRDGLVAALLAAGGGAGGGGGGSAGGGEAAGAQAQASVARCVAALAVPAGGGGGGGLPPALLSMAASKDPSQQRLALLTIGEIGRRCPLAAAAPAARAAAVAALAGGGEEAKGAASVALGGLASLPELCSMVEAAAGEPARQYLLLQALGELLTALVARAAEGEEERRRAAAGGGGGMEEAEAAAPPLDAARVSELLALLLRCASGEEECAAAVADCLGHLALLAPEQARLRLGGGGLSRGVVGALADALPSADAAVRCAAAGAVKSMVSQAEGDGRAAGGRAGAAAAAAAAALGERLPDFLGLISDGDRRVRKAAVLALSSVSHHRPRLVAPHLPRLLPALFAQTAIDDGLDLRKAAFECLDILLDAAPGALDPPEFLACLVSGLGDHPDVRAPAHHMLARTAAAAPAAVLAQLDALIDPLEKTLTARTKSDAVKQEIDRHEESLRSCLRAVDALDRLPGSSSVPRWPEFMRRTPGGAALRDKLAAVRAEREEAAAGAAGAGACAARA